MDTVVLFSILCGVIFFWGFNRLYKYHIIRDIPRSKIRSLALGLVEISGTVIDGQLISTPISGTTCVYYGYEIEKYRSKGWYTIASDEKGAPFFLEDDTGRVLIEPEGADISSSLTETSLRKWKIPQPSESVFQALEQLEVTKGAAVDLKIFRDIREEISQKPEKYRIGDLRYSEWCIKPGDHLYVLGSAENRNAKSSELMIHRGEHDSTFLISDESEQVLLRSVRHQTIFSFLVGALFLIAAVIAYYVM